MKDVILWQSDAAREREKRYLAKLGALHQLATPPRELLLPVPRRLRWKSALKFWVGFDLVLLVAAICATIWCCMLATRLYNDTVHDIRLGNEKMRRYATQTTDPSKRAKAEKSIREGEELERRWHALHTGMLVVIFLGVLAGPVSHVIESWFLHIQPDLILLREGTPVRGTVVSKKRWFLAGHLEVGFTTERGESIRKKQVVREKEASLFQAGSPVWMLYLPRRPKRARIYGLKSACAEVEP